MKLSIDELINSPYLNGLEHTLEQLENTEYQTKDNCTRVLYKGLPYLIKQEKNKYTLLGYTWMYGTGSTTEPYYPPKEHLIPCFDVPDVLAGIKYITGKCRVPDPGKFPEYAEFYLADRGLWELMEARTDRTFLERLRMLGEKEIRWNARYILNELKGLIK